MRSGLRSAPDVRFLAALVLLDSPLSCLVLAVSIFAVVAHSAPEPRVKEWLFLGSATSSTRFVSPAAYGLVLLRAQFAVAL